MTSAVPGVNRGTGEPYRLGLALHAHDWPDGLSHRPTRGRRDQRPPHPAGRGTKPRPGLSGGRHAAHRPTRPCAVGVPVSGRAHRDDLRPPGQAANVRLCRNEHVVPAHEHALQGMPIRRSAISGRGLPSAVQHRESRGLPAQRGRSPAQGERLRGAPISPVTAALLAGWWGLSPGHWGV